MLLSLACLIRQLHSKASLTNLLQDPESHPGCFSGHITHMVCCLYTYSVSSGGFVNVWAHTGCSRFFCRVRLAPKHAKGSPTTMSQHALQLPGCASRSGAPATSDYNHSQQQHLKPSCRLRCGTISRGFRGFKVPGPLLSPSPDQQQPQQQQQQQPSCPPGGSVLDFLPWVGPSSDKQQPAAEPVQEPVLSFLPWVGPSSDKQPAAEPVQEPVQQQQHASRQDTAMPSDYMALLSVSLLWGSYAPALRYLYSMDELLTPQVGGGCGVQTVVLSALG